MLDMSPQYGMLALVELGRPPAGDGDVLGRRLDQIVGQAGALDRSPDRGRTPPSPRRDAETT